MLDILLVDNGSIRPEATLGLRRLAVELGDRTRKTIHPVSLQHAGRAPISALGGEPAQTLEPFLWRRARDGVRNFLVLPLFFGRSRALTTFIPEQQQTLAEEFEGLTVDVADELYSLPKGEPRLAALLLDNVRRSAGTRTPDRIVLVDHGSPIPEVTEVRRRLAEDLRGLLDGSVELREAVMERRRGTQYDFNGELLEEVVAGMAREDAARPVDLAMLFLSPGRHAGPGGDIEAICRGAQDRYPGFRVTPSALVGEHPGLIAILADRLADAVSRSTAQRSSDSVSTARPDRF